MVWYVYDMFCKVAWINVTGIFRKELFFLYEVSRDNFIKEGILELGFEVCIGVCKVGKSWEVFLDRKKGVCNVWNCNGVCLE